MKKIYLLALMLTVGTVLISSCKKEEEPTAPEPNPTEQWVYNDDGGEGFEITASQWWWSNDYNAYICDYYYEGMGYFDYKINSISKIEVDDGNQTFLLLSGEYKNYNSYVRLINPDYTFVTMYFWVDYKFDHTVK